MDESRATREVHIEHGAQHRAYRSARSKSCFVKSWRRANCARTSRFNGSFSPMYSPMAVFFRPSVCRSRMQRRAVRRRGGGAKEEEGGGRREATHGLAKARGKRKREVLATRVKEKCRDG